MSIIYGYLSLNNKPVDRGTLENMEHAMDFWGPDGRGVWLEGSCGLGNLLLYNTPEALFEKLPMTDASGNLVLTAGARIDNREELFRIFDVSLGQRLTMPDSMIILKAYEKWGEACADHLVGDWAFAIWDRRLQKLFVARDHHGITAMYYYKGSDFFVFSSSLKGLLCLPNVPKKVNEFKIAQLLVNWNEGGPETCYLDIMRLPPAHTLTVQEGKLTTNRYWYLENTPEVRLKNDQEYIDMFRDLYTEAVRCRLRSHRPVGATLSSGLDSGSVCILAAQELAKEGKRLQAFTSVPLYDITGLVPKNRIGDEGPYAQALADKLGNVDVMLCKAENISPLEGIERMLEIQDEPNFAASNAYWIIDLLKASKILNIGTMLIGQCGNSTVSWPVGSELPGNLTFHYKILLENKYKAKYLLGIWKNKYLISDQLIKKYQLKKLTRNLKLLPYSSSKCSLAAKRKQIFNAGKTMIGDIWSKIGISFSMEVRDSTIDLHLVKFLFGIPDEHSFSHNRNMFESNFKGFFSGNVIKSEIRGVQAFDLLKRLDNEKDSLEKLFSYEDKLIKGYISKERYNKQIWDCNKRNILREFIRIYQMELFFKSFQY